MMLSKSKYPMSDKTRYMVVAELRQVTRRINAAVKHGSTQGPDWDYGLDVRTFIKSLEDDLQRIRETIVY